METKPNKTWILKGIAFLLLLVTLIPCPHQFIGHRCKIWTRVKNMEEQTESRSSDAETVAKSFFHVPFSTPILIY
jgi:hypothetical protein